MRSHSVRNTLCLLVICLLILSGCAQKSGPNMSHVKKKMTELGHLYGRGQMCEVDMNDNSLTIVKKYLHDNTESDEKADEMYAVFTDAAKAEESKGYADTPCTDAENEKLTQAVRLAWYKLQKK